MFVRGSVKWLTAGVLLTTTVMAVAQPGSPMRPAPATGKVPSFGQVRVVARGQASELSPPMQSSRCGTPTGPAPFGASVSAHINGHVTAATAARMALYDYDFLPGNTQLNARGVDRVWQIARVIGNFNNPVVVERTSHSPTLADGRRQAVLDELARIGFAVAPERVVVGMPSPVPLQGVEAESIYENLLLQTQSSGRSPGTGAGTFGGGSSTGSSTTSGNSSDNRR